MSQCGSKIVGICLVSVDSKRVLDSAATCVTATIATDVYSMFEAAYYCQDYFIIIYVEEIR